MAMPVGTEPGRECRSSTRGFDHVSLLFEERKHLGALPGVVGIPTWPEGFSHPTASPKDIPDFPAATGCPTQSFISRQACPGRTAAECLITKLFSPFFPLITTTQRGASSLYFQRHWGNPAGAAGASQGSALLDAHPRHWRVPRSPLAGSIHISNPMTSHSPAQPSLPTVNPAPSISQGGSREMLQKNLPWGLLSLFLPSGHEAKNLEGNWGKGEAPHLETFPQRGAQGRRGERRGCFLQQPLLACPQWEFILS